jgi:hypothetical protein
VSQIIPPPVAVGVYTDAVIEGVADVAAGADCWANAGSAVRRHPVIRGRSPRERNGLRMLRGEEASVDR